MVTFLASRDSGQDYPLTWLVSVKVNFYPLVAPAISRSASDVFGGVSILQGFIIAFMKPLPAPNVPGRTESERFDNALRHVFTVSKEDLLKKETKEKRKRQRQKPDKK